MISLAQQLIELGRREQAQSYLRNGRAEAIRRCNTFWIEDADGLNRPITRTLGQSSQTEGDQRSRCAHGSITPGTVTGIRRTQSS